LRQLLFKALSPVRRIYGVAISVSAIQQRNGLKPVASRSKMDHTWQGKEAQWPSHGMTA